MHPPPVCTLHDSVQNAKSDCTITCILKVSVRTLPIGWDFPPNSSLRTRNNTAYFLPTLFKNGLNLKHNKYHILKQICNFIINFMIFVFLSQFFVVVIYALFPPIFVGSWIDSATSVYQMHKPNFCTVQNTKYASQRTKFFELWASSRSLLCTSRSHLHKGSSGCQGLFSWQPNTPTGKFQILVQNTNTNTIMNTNTNESSNTNTSQKQQLA